MEVLPWLYIGNAYHASCVDRLSACGISALLNMSDSARDDVTMTSSGDDRKQLCQLKMAVTDSCSSDIARRFPQAIDFIGDVTLLSLVLLYYLYVFRFRLIGVGCMGSFSYFLSLRH